MDKDISGEKLILTLLLKTPRHEDKLPHYTRRCTLKKSIVDGIYQDSENWKSGEPKLPFSSLSDLISRLANPERGTWKSIDNIEIIEAILTQLNSLKVILRVYPDFERKVAKCHVEIINHRAYFNGSSKPLFDLTDENCGGLRINMYGKRPELLVDFRRDGWESYIFIV